MNIPFIIDTYNLQELTLGVLGSHSALDVCLGGKKEGFKTLVIAQKGREKVYTDSYKSREGMGCVDEVITLDSFKDVLKKENQEELRKKNVLFVPHRSFQVYLDFDYEAIENGFEIPIFGNRYLFKIEERDRRPNQYDLLKEAGIRTPRIFNSPDEIDRPVMAKVLEKERGFERAFFLAATPEDFREKSSQFISRDVFTKEALDDAVIEEFIAGVQVNLNYFYSPISQHLEFLGSDTRRQTNIEGLSRLPFSLGKDIEKQIRLKFEEAGHVAVTILESMLDDVFKLGERFVKTAREAYPPGIIGPFALQSFVLPGPPKKEFVVFDVSCRMPGSPGLRATPYGEYLWRKPISMGERIAMEIKEAKDKNSLGTILT